MSGLFAALSAGLAWIGAIIDPLCGPAGIFRWFGSGTLLACGDAGWGDEIAYGFLVTASLAVATLPVGLVIGFFVALAKQSEEKSLRLAGNIYTTIFRGLPELLTLFIVYYGLQILVQQFLATVGYEGAVEINAFVAGMIALGVVFSAYCSEVLLSAFKAIPHGQYEAGDALGLHRGKTMRLIILPQLIRIALPASAISGWRCSRIPPLSRSSAFRTFSGKPGSRRASPSMPSSSSASPAFSSSSWR